MWLWSKATPPPIPEGARWGKAFTFSGCFLQRFQIILFYFFPKQTTCHSLKNKLLTNYLIEIIYHKRPCRHYAGLWHTTSLLFLELVSTKMLISVDRVSNISFGLPQIPRGFKIFSEVTVQVQSKHLFHFKLHPR